MRPLKVDALQDEPPQQQPWGVVAFVEVVSAWPDIDLTIDPHKNVHWNVTTLRIGALIAAGVVLMALSYTWIWARTPSPAACVKWQLQVLGYFDLFLAGILVSSLAPTALPISQELGHGAGFSGLLLSSMFILTAPGAVLGRFVATRASQETKRVLQSILIAVAAGCCIITGIITQDMQLFAWVSSKKDVIFIAARAVCGFAMFTWVSIMFAMTTEVAQPALRVRQQMHQNLFLMAGSGSGPLVVAIVTSSSENTGVATLGLAAPFYISAALYMVHSICAWLVTPACSDWMIAAAAEEVDSSSDGVMTSTSIGTRVGLPEVLPSEERSLWLRKVIFCLGNLYGVERSVVTISLEAATSYILQTHFSWTTSKVAIWVGIVYLLGTVVSLPLNLHKDDIGELNLMKFGSVLGVVASVVLALFMYRAECVVLVMDFFLFTASTLASGVAEGMSLAAAIPDDPWFNQETAWCFRNAVKQNLGRFCAPLLVRSTIEKSPTLYGTMQVALTVCGFVLCYSLVDAVKELQVRSKLQGRRSSTILGKSPKHDAGRTAMALSKC
mmetsp:Transcript_10811/g.24717  ORF Transcript_10811/g.24717 Transcript_10811/m.24717 type:complete len:555 (+) Transcript_10811:114-1778(+)|eukprot:CAMPEP_0178377966 /NCGR_PEP_ID=MMETSP0689_2-20121128/4186_1 /TAXON_ID=160604 /ORGANISM="Amphidinium massartii, Strain CS-259" /LENGTH=554 /DNA_ID=CAMNT_0019998027 /DNA_START=60 /DNA_END=1724 /DNA_ORIENTATION=+